MKVLTNKGRRRLGVPGRPAIIIDANQGVPITEAQLEDIQKNRTVSRWLDAGVLVVSDGPLDLTPVSEPAAAPRAGRGRTARDRDKREEVELPEGVTGEGIESHHIGGGWWEVYVNGFKVTDHNVRKDEAESIASEYEE
jgi:hypothetical protein